MRLVVAYYVHDLAAGTPISARRLIRGGVHSVIEDPAGPIRRRIAQFVEDLDIRMPSPEEGKTLAVPPGLPVARVLRTAYDSEGEPSSPFRPNPQHPNRLTKLPGRAEPADAAWPQLGRTRWSTVGQGETGQHEA